MGAGLGLQEKQGTFVWEEKRKRDRTTIGTFFSVHVQALKQKGTSYEGDVGGCKPLQPSQNFPILKVP